ncbi:MAG TPA: ADOP family duplicated permease [Vicinamibacterales bacterium]|nr:ADOP family duplicated permease [Vicinamibacterales bacterium]
MLVSVLRGLVRRPTLILAATATLALGIGAATALFSTVNAALLKPLPYSRAEDIYTVRTFFPSGRFTSGLVATEELAALRQMSDAVLASAAVFRSDSVIDSGSTRRQVTGYGVSETFFDLAGTPMALGHALAPADHVRGAPRSIVLSHALWISAFGGRADVVGHTVTLGGEPARVAGVAPAGFDLPAGTDLWWNLYEGPANIGHLYEGYVRLTPGVTVESLHGRMTQAMAALGAKYPDQNNGRAFRLRPLLDDTVGDLGPVLIILFAATGLLLVLASVNVMNLLLARSTGRSREMAVRAALGASRRRIMAHMLSESLVISAVGGAAGIGAAYAAVRLLERLGGSRLPRLDSIGFDGAVWSFVGATIVLTGLVVGILPALRTARTDLSAVINESGRTVHGSRTTRRMLGLFVVVEIAVAVALVAGAVRLVRSFDHLHGIDPGFVAGDTLVVDVLLPANPYGNQQRINAWWETVEHRLRDVGAKRVAAASALPLQHEWDTTTFVDISSRRDIPPDQRPNGRLRRVSADFFSVMGVSLVAGRSFTRDDAPGAPGVAIVNQAFVRRFLGAADPLRERVSGFRYRRVDGRVIPEEVAIVGVAADVRFADLTVPAEPTVYVPITQMVVLRQSLVLTAANGAAEQLVPAARQALAAVDPNVAVEFGSMLSLVASSLERQRLGMLLMSAFGAAALLLTTIGVFGVIAYVVAQRTTEMAVRQALGATRPQVFWLVLSHGAVMSAAGIGLGVVLAWWTGRLLASYVYDVNAADPLVLGGSALLVALVAVSATLIPASRAARGELVRALRGA